MRTQMEQTFYDENNNDPAINIDDTKRLLQAEKVLNKNTHQIAFAFGVPPNWDKLTDTEKENVYRELDGLHPLAEPIECVDEEPRAVSNKSKRYI